jgi:Uma2 family endonuclease
MNALVAPKLVSMEEYLDTAYSPDCEFVDGVVVARELGERPHSRIQSNLIFALRGLKLSVFVWPALRMRTEPGRCRVPDLCVTVADPMEDVLTTPPLICIEILSSRDETGDVMEKLAEYLAFGVPHIWLIDPRRKKAFLFDGALREVAGQSLTAPEAGIELPLDSVFLGL